MIEFGLRAGAVAATWRGVWQTARAANLTTMKDEKNACGVKSAVIEAALGARWLMRAHV